MDNSKTTLERAFEMAKSGKHTSISEIRAALSGEGYSLAQITGGALQKQLRELIKASVEVDAATE